MHSLPIPPCHPSDCHWCCMPLFTGWSFSMGSAYQFHSWRVFVVVCALPCVCAVVALTFMPESPRFYLEVMLFSKLLLLNKSLHWNSYDPSWICCNSCIFKNAVSLSPTCLSVLTFNICRIVHQVIESTWTFPNIFLIRSNSVSHLKLLEEALYVQIKAWKFVTVGLLLQDNYPLK